MRASQKTPVRPTRLARLSPGAAMLIMLALLLLIAAGLALSPTREAGGAPDGGDASLYRQITARVAAGQNYYDAAAVEQRASGYPLKPFTAVRLPVLAEFTAMLGPTGADLALRLLAIAAVAGTAMRLAPLLRSPLREGTILLSAASAGAFVQTGMSVWHELWAGLLITLALACRSDRRWRLSVALGLAAARVRELAFPFLLVMAAAAWVKGGRREARAWSVAALIVLAALAIHMRAVSTIALASDVTSPGWLALGGWLFDLPLARQSLLFGLPAWAVAIATPLALLGWCAWPGGYAARASALLILWMTCFLFMGRPDNAYWGFLFAPLLPVGLALAPAALRDLAGAALAGRLGAIAAPTAR